jgi:hypothetical protein
MPRSFRLTWQPGRNGRAGRWLKKYKKVRYYFSGGSGKYDREAYEAALDAWEKQRSRIEQEAPRKHQLDYEVAIDRWEQVLAWSGRHSEPQLAETAFQKLGTLRKMLAATILEPLPKSETFEATFRTPSIDLGEILNNRPAPEDMSRIKLAAPIDLSPECVARYARELDGSPDRIASEIWDDRLEVERRKSTSDDESLDTYVKKYVKQKSGQADAGEVSVGRVYALVAVHGLIRCDRTRRT